MCGYSSCQLRCANYIRFVSVWLLAFHTFCIMKSAPRKSITKNGSRQLLISSYLRITRVRRWYARQYRDAVAERVGSISRLQWGAYPSALPISAPLHILRVGSSSSAPGGAAPSSPLSIGSSAGTSTPSTPPPPPLAGGPPAPLPSFPITLVAHPGSTINVTFNVAHPGSVINVVQHC